MVPFGAEARRVFVWRSGFIKTDVMGEICVKEFSCLLFVTKVHGQRLLTHLSQRRALLVTSACHVLLLAASILVGRYYFIVRCG